MVAGQNVELARVVEISRVQLARGYCTTVGGWACLPPPLSPSKASSPFLSSKRPSPLPSFFLSFLLSFFFLPFFLLFSDVIFSFPYFLLFKGGGGGSMISKPEKQFGRYNKDESCCLAWPVLASLGLAWPGLAWPGLAWPGLWRCHLSPPTAHRHKLPCKIGSGSLSPRAGLCTTQRRCPRPSGATSGPHPTGSSSVGPRTARRRRPPRTTAAAGGTSTGQTTYQVSFSPSRQLRRKGPDMKISHASTRPFMEKLRFFMSRNHPKSGDI